MSESRGITLIVLIITIVVLLILAGVTVAHITGGEGIIEQASERRDEATIANEKDILGNVVIEATDKFGDITEDNLRTALSKYNVEITPSGGLYRIVFKESNNLYKMNHQGEFFYWENMQPTDVFAKFYADGTLIFSSKSDTTYKDFFTGTLSEPELVGAYVIKKYTDYAYPKNQVKLVIIYDKISPIITREMFYGCTELKEIKGIENLHTENVTNMNRMFCNCSNLEKLDVSNFDTSKVTDMAQLFEGCKQLKILDVSKFDTSNVKSITRMFYGCNNVQNLDVSNFNTSNVNSSMGSMFLGCSSLTSLNVSNFNTSKVTSIDNMFNGCSNLMSLDVSNFDTSNVTAMNGTFTYCSKIKNLNVKNFNTSKVKNMKSMFGGCSALLYVDVSNFDTQLVENMDAMFTGCSSLNVLNLLSFNTTKVTSMINMFSGCSKLTELDLSSFDTHNVTQMSAMFLSCSNLITIYASENFIVEQVTSYPNMFFNATSLMGAAGTTYVNTSNPRDKRYAHVDGGPSNPGYFTLKEN